MYHLILIATLVTGGEEQTSGGYYDTKAQCMNRLESIPSELARERSFCDYVDGEWFPSNSSVEYCRKIRAVANYAARCDYE